MSNNLDPNREIEFWRKKAIDYEYLYHQQRKMAEEYSKLLKERQRNDKDQSRCF